MKTKNVNGRRGFVKRNACPMCGCKELLEEGPDQFCLSCDWDTCAEYVERGLMNNIQIAYREHFGSQKPISKQKTDCNLASVFVEEAPIETETRINEWTA